MQTVDFRLSCKRNVAAAKVFLRKAVRTQASSPTSITLDGYAASHRAVQERQEQEERPKTARLQSSKYLNNVIAQDHRNIKLRLGPMLGFKRFLPLAGMDAKLSAGKFTFFGRRVSKSIRQCSSTGGGLEKLDNGRGVNERFTHRSARGSE